MAKTAKQSKDADTMIAERRAIKAKQKRGTKNPQIPTVTIPQISVLVGVRQDRQREEARREKIDREYAHLDDEMSHKGMVFVPAGNEFYENRSRFVKAWAKNRRYWYEELPNGLAVILPKRVA